MVDETDDRITVRPEPRRQRGRPKAFNDKTEQNTIKSLDRAMEALSILARMEGATLTALADEAEQSPATVYRVLTTLEARGLVEQDPAAQTWHVGPAAFLIGSAFLRRTSLAERSRPIMRELMETTGETANLAIEREGRVLFISQVETHASIRAFFPPGTLSPFHASGVGKALMAAGSADRASALMGRGSLEAFTPKTIVEPEAMAAELATVRERGYAVDDEERTLGMRCVAAAVFNAHGEATAGLSVSGPSNRLTAADVPRVAEAVMDGARRLSAALGARV
ncbi:MAG: HTH-type transcriptional regulator BhcR [Pseudomonadota bacterium]